MDGALLVAMAALLASALPGAAPDAGSGDCPEAGSALPVDAPDGKTDSAHETPAPSAPGFSSVVRAERPRETASERRIDHEALQAQPHHTGDDLLRLVPGMLVTRHGAEGKGLQLFLRGFDAAHGTDVEVVVAGVPINELSNVHGQGYVDLGFVIPEVVDSVEAFEGPFRLFQGDFATAGTVRYKLGVPAGERGLRFSYELGSTFRNRLLGVWAPKESGRETFVAVEVLSDEGYGANRSTRRATVLAQARVAPLVSLTCAAYGAEFGSPGTLPLADVTRGRVGFYDSYSPNLRDRSARALVAAQIGEPGGALQGVVHLQGRYFEVQDNYTGWLLDPVNGDGREQQQTAWQGGARVSWEPRLASTLVLLTAAGWTGDFIDQREDHIDMDARKVGVNRDLSLFQQGAFALVGAKWTPWSWLLVDGGLRGDLFYFSVDDRIRGVHGATDTVGQLSPRLALSVPLGDWTLFAAGGRGLRAPEAWSVTAVNRPTQGTSSDQYSGGEPRVSAAESVEVGVGFARSAWRASLVGFGTWMQHELVFDHVSGVNLEMNSTRRLGGQLSASVAPLDWLRIGAVITAVNAAFVETGHPVPGAPWLLGTLHVDARHPLGFHGGLEAFYVAPRPLANGATAADGGNLDLLVGWSRDGLDLTVQVDNLLGLQWQDGVYHFASWWDRSVPRSEIPRIHFAAGPSRAIRAALTVRY